MHDVLRFRTCLLFSLILLLAACSGQRVLMPTPNVVVNSPEDHYEDLHPEQKSTEVPLFYITDPGPPGRPLTDLSLNFWAVSPGYPAASSQQ